MKQSDIFGGAKWIAASVDALSGGMIIRKNFSLSGGERAKLYVIGLGLSLLPILVMEIAKAVGFGRKKHHNA